MTKCNLKNFKDNILLLKFQIIIAQLHLLNLLLIQFSELVSLLKSINTLMERERLLNTQIPMRQVLMKTSSSLKRILVQVKSIGNTPGNTT